MANLNWKSLFEILYDQSPDYSMLRTIGYLCFAANVGEKDKFERRAHKCILLGYTFGYKGYKLYDLQTKKKFHSRDVLFKEITFPFKTSTVHTDIPDKDIKDPILPSLIPSSHFDSSQEVSYSNPSPDIISSPFEVVHQSDYHPPSSNHNLSSPIGSGASPHPSFSPLLSSGQADVLDSTIPPLLSGTEALPRKSTRVKGPPTWLKDYICSTTTNKATSQHPISTPATTSQSHSLQSTSTHPLFLHSHLAHVSSDYVASLLHVLHKPEPKYYSQAKLYPEWEMAMNHELQALEQNHTWILTSLPPGKKALTSKWVYKTKYNPDGSVERHKARLVIRGFEQVKDKNYKQTFSQVAKLTTVRVFIVTATAKNWPLHQLDINNAFLHGYIDEEVYMTPPEGYSKAKPRQVCKLQRSLYGLKQASKQWNLELTKFLQSKGFIQSKSDYSLFTRNNTGLMICILVYVDDLLIT